ncbi:MAG: hypothetical protein J6T04_05690 [Bacteroidales bacterium]|nr:hypothetical protein [Bacteroidales bacterium]
MGIRATVLKGRAISQYYALPHHRYSCDLDVFIGEGWERACELLESGEPTFFEGTMLVCPPLMFSVMLYVEHALGDFLRGKLLLKHVVDWVVLRRQAVDWEAFRTKCKEFCFDRFVALIEALADVVEGQMEYDALPSAYKDAFDEMLLEQEASASAAGSSVV